LGSESGLDMDRPAPDPNISHYGADAAGNYANLPKATLEMANHD